MNNPETAKGGEGPKSWVQFDEAPNDQHAGQDPLGAQEQGLGTTPPTVSLGPISPSKQVQETPPRPHESTQDPSQPSIPPPPQKQPRNSSPIPLSQLPNNPLAPQRTESPQPTLPPPPQAKPRQKPTDSAPAVIDAQSVQVSLDTSRPNSGDVSKAGVPHTNGIQRQSSTASHIAADTRISMSQLNASQLQNVPLNDANATSNQTSNNNPRQPVIRQGFANGDVIVTLLPQNNSLPWVTPAKFRPELVPEELMAQGLTLTVEDYVHIMSQLVSDPRFTLYNICYKRILICWIFLGFVILLSILFSGLQQIQLFGAGIAWLLVNAAAIFFCMWVKIKLNKSLEECIAEINLQLMKHKILLGLDDRGKLSCHKVNLCFIYFDSQDCLVKLQDVLSNEERNGREEPKLRITPNRTDDQNPDIIRSGVTNTHLAQQQEKAKLLFAKYSQRWVKALHRKYLVLAVDTGDRALGNPPTLPPRHIATKQCACQYIEDILYYKPQGDCLFCVNLAESMKVHAF